MSGGIVEREHYSTLPSNWSGTCVLVQLVIPFSLAFHNSAHWGSQQIPQSKRETPGGSFDDSIQIAEELDTTSNRKRLSTRTDCSSQ
jgi:hypothetical protein